jgi:hypothetical protein
MGLTETRLAALEAAARDDRAWLRQVLTQVIGMAEALSVTAARIATLVEARTPYTPPRPPQTSIPTDASEWTAYMQRHHPDVLRDSGEIPLTLTDDHERIPSDG